MDDEMVGYRFVDGNYEKLVDCAFCVEPLWIAAEPDVDIEADGYARASLYALNVQPYAVALGLDDYAHPACAERVRVLESEAAAIAAAADGHRRIA